MVYIPVQELYQITVRLYPLCIKDNEHLSKGAAESCANGAVKAQNSSLCFYVA
jgi:hypothetical protein